ncbi:MAG: trypsin-like serine protease [Chloroflexi bacterium]|nr:trypsin-like serine protease [Chloroflexota bacterium]
MPHQPTALCCGSNLRGGNPVKRLLYVLLILALLLPGAATPASAITEGELDGNRHPHVGLMVAQDANGNPMWRCSGTLLAKKVFLTAGHCTSGAAHVEIWFDADVESGIPDNGYPFKGDVGGTPYTHPDYSDSAFYLHDVGVVVLNKPTRIKTYASLPEVNILDKMATERGKQNVTFTAVGYGLQRINPVFVEAERVRYLARPYLVQINAPGFTGDFSVLLSNNHSTGGTCFGDSGGPNFIDDSNVVGGVTSFGLNGNCAGTGGVFRMDRQNVLDFVNGYLN